jgi:hypothetical protein
MFPVVYVEVAMSVWLNRLPFPITPKSGPMRPMQTLAEMNKALTKDLPFRLLCQAHWQHAARLVVRAAEAGMTDDIQLACDAVVEALDHEGWMTAAPAHLRLSIAA